MTGREGATPVAPGRAGYRWPAEWEPHRATWLAWPHNRETWPGGLGPVEDAFCEMVRAIVPGETVEILVADAEMAGRVGARLAGAGLAVDERIRFREVPTDDAWIRDHGGIFVVATRDAAPKRPGRLLLDFAFDAWGGKYPPWDRDAGVGRAMAARCGVGRVESPFVLEAGSIDGDGEGTILTTKSCLLDAKRARPGQERDREAMERLLRDTLGATRVLWLGEGLEGDDTDGHVDDLTRFVAPGRLVTVVEPDPRDANHRPLSENRRRLETLRDAAGRSLEVVELPSAGRIEGAEGRLPASYANFYVSNAALLVPVFDVPADREALTILERCFPTRAITPIPGRPLVEGLGAVHCLTQQEPAAPILPDGGRAADEHDGSPPAPSR